MERMITAIDNFNIALGRIGRWCYPVICAIIVFNVFARYTFSQTYTSLEEAVIYLNSVGFFLCLAYAYVREDHVRIDVFSASFTRRTRAWVELLGNIFLLLPFCTIVGYYAWQFFLRSWRILEGTLNPGGLPILFVIKLAFFLALVFLGLQSISRIISSTRFLISGRKA